MNQASHYVDLIQWIVGPAHRKARAKRDASLVVLDHMGQLVRE